MSHGNTDVAEILATPTANWLRTTAEQEAEFRQLFIDAVRRRALHKMAPTLGSLLKHQRLEEYLPERKSTKPTDFPRSRPDGSGIIQSHLMFSAEAGRVVCDRLLNFVSYKDPEPQTLTFNVQYQGRSAGTAGTAFLHESIRPGLMSSAEISDERFRLTHGCVDPIPFVWMEGMRCGAQSWPLLSEILLRHPEVGIAVLHSWEPPNRHGVPYTDMDFIAYSIPPELWVGSEENHTARKFETRAAETGARFGNHGIVVLVRTDLEKEVRVHVIHNRSPNAEWKTRVKIEATFKH